MKFSFKKWNWMKVIRRLHLYSGIFLVPWVMLYGVSAFLFNHPFSLSENPVLKIEGDHFQGSSLENSVDAWSDARAVVDALNLRFAKNEEGSRRLEISDSVPPRYLKETLSLRARGPGTSHIVAYEIPNNQATISLGSEEQAVAAPFEVRGLKVPDSLAERVKSSLPHALKKIDVHVDEIGIATGSVLRFCLTADDQLWIADYQIQTGTVIGRRVDTPRDFSLRQFLLDLHRTHAYPSSWTWRWLWAFWVDCMAGAMLLWSLTGILMWWQLKKQRRIGLILALAGLGMFGVTVSALLSQMY